MVATSSLPSLSQVQTLDTTHLQEADQYWTRTGNLSDQVFTEIHETISTPGGTSWNGQAATAAEERAYIDLMKVRGAAFQLHEAAGIARRGDEQVQACKQEVLDAVRDAREAGFEVGESYSVTDRSQGGSAEFRAERLTQAAGHAAFIRHRVAALVAVDRHLTTQITVATEGINNLTFEETPLGADDTTDGRDKHIVVQPVDHHWKQEPAPTPKPGPAAGPTADDIRRVLQKLPQGDQPWIREVRTPEDLQNLWRWMTQNGIDNPNRYGDPATGEIGKIYLTEPVLANATQLVRLRNRRLMFGSQAGMAIPRCTSTLGEERLIFRGQPSQGHLPQEDRPRHRSKSHWAHLIQLKPRQRSREYPSCPSGPALPRIHLRLAHIRFTGPSTIVSSRRC